jgi:FkbM family methyltransferase
VSSALHTAQTYLRSLGVRGLSAAIKGKVLHRPALLTVTRPDLKAAIVLRVPSADFATYRQIFDRREYDFAVSNPPRTIVDAGAHIGLASVWFANRFPDARIVAVEPDAENFELLRHNAAAYPQIEPVQAALWSVETELDLVDPGLGTWGFMTSPVGDPSPPGEHRQRVRALTIDALMREHRLDHIDVLKLDVEGAEREVFTAAGPWLEGTDLLIVELHERLKVGCNRAFYGATAGFDQEWFRGENVYVARRRAGARPAN